jgi:hypothetical protein
MSKIIQNAVMVDGIVYRSTHVHDFVTLPDGRAIDGGHEYLRRVGAFTEEEDLSLDEESDLLDIWNKLTWGTYGLDGKGPLKWVRIRDMDLDHINKVLEMFSAGLHPTTLGTLNYWFVRKQEYTEAVRWLKNNHGRICETLSCPYARLSEDFTLRDLVEDLREIAWYQDQVLQGDR